MKQIILALMLIAVIAGVGYLAYKKSPQEARNAKEIKINGSALINAEQTKQNSMAGNKTPAARKLVTLETNMGKIVLELYGEDAPKTVENFTGLVNKGFYNGLTFHRVISGFMIQGGDPNCTISRSKGACGAGGPGYQFADELNPETPSYKEGYKRGVLAMANAGPNTNGSQFFIMHKDYPLDHNYTIFGKVVSGMDVVDSIAGTKTSGSDKPVKTMEIIKATVSQN